MDDDELDEIDESSKKPKLKNKKVVVAAVAVAAIVLIAAFFILGDNPINDDDDGQNYPPIAEAGGDRTVYRAEKVTFDASNTTDQNFDDLTYSWEFSDGISMNGKIITRYFNVTGDYDCSLTVSDGKEQSKDDISIVVLDPEPSGPPAVNLESISANLLSPNYKVSVLTSEPAEDIANFSFAIIQKDTGQLLYKDDVSELGSSGNVTFIDLLNPNVMDSGDVFIISTSDSSLDVQDGDKFVLYYKINDTDELLDEVEFESVSPTLNYQN